MYNKKSLSPGPIDGHAEAYERLPGRRLGPAANAASTRSSGLPRVHPARAAEQRSTVFVGRRGGGAEGGQLHDIVLQHVSARRVLLQVGVLLQRYATQPHVERMNYDHRSRHRRHERQHPRDAGEAFACHYIFAHLASHSRD